MVGSPTTVDYVEKGVGCGASGLFGRTYLRLQRLLKQEFRPAAYVLVQLCPGERALWRRVSYDRGRAINSAYWRMYRCLEWDGARTLVV